MHNKLLCPGIISSAALQEHSTTNSCRCSLSLIMVWSSNASVKHQGIKSTLLDYVRMMGLQVFLLLKIRTLTKNLEHLYTCLIYAVNPSQLYGSSLMIQDSTCLVSSGWWRLLLVWGMIFCNTLGLLIAINHHLNSTAYLNIVADHVHPFTARVYLLLIF